MTLLLPGDFSVLPADVLLGPLRNLPLTREPGTRSVLVHTSGPCPLRPGGDPVTLDSSTPPTVLSDCPVCGADAVSVVDAAWGAIGDAVTTTASVLERAQDDPHEAAQATYELDPSWAFAGHYLPVKIGEDLTDRFGDRLHTDRDLAGYRDQLVSWATNWCAKQRTDPKVWPATTQGHNTFVAVNDAMLHAAAWSGNLVLRGSTVLGHHVLAVFPASRHELSFVAVLRVTKEDADVMTDTHDARSWSRRVGEINLVQQPWLETLSPDVAGLATDSDVLKTALAAFAANHGRTRLAELLEAASVAAA